MHLMSQSAFHMLSKPVNTPNPCNWRSQLSMNRALAAALQHDGRCAQLCLFNFSFRQCDALTFFLLLLCKHGVALIISTASSKNNNRSALPGLVPLVFQWNKWSFILQHF